MKIHLRFQDKTVTATLLDNLTAKDFVALLPITLTLTDYGDTEKIGDLPQELSKAGTLPLPFRLGSRTTTWPPVTVLKRMQSPHCHCAESQAASPLRSDGSAGRAGSPSPPRLHIAAGRA